jgi:hypothetical protein
VKAFFDVAIPLAFILFLVFIFAGYHASKRDQEKRD